MVPCSPLRLATRLSAEISTCFHVPLPRAGVYLHRNLCGIAGEAYGAVIGNEESPHRATIRPLASLDADSDASFSEHIASKSTVTWPVSKIHTSPRLSANLTAVAKNKRRCQK